MKTFNLIVTGCSLAGKHEYEGCGYMPNLFKKLDYVGFKMHDPDTGEDWSNSIPISNDPKERFDWEKNIFSVWRHFTEPDDETRDQWVARYGKYPVYPQNEIP